MLGHDVLLKRILSARRILILANRLGFNMLQCVPLCNKFILISIIFSIVLDHTEMKTFR